MRHVCVRTLHPHYTVLCSGDANRVVHVPPAKGRMLIIVHAGGEAAWVPSVPSVPNALLNWRLPRHNERRALHEVANRQLLQNVPLLFVMVPAKLHRTAPLQQAADAQLADRQKVFFQRICLKSNCMNLQNWGTLTLNTTTLIILSKTRPCRPACHRPGFKPIETIWTLVNL